VLQKLIGIDQLLKPGAVYEEVIDAVYFTGAWCARSGGDDEVVRIMLIRHPLKDGVFADARRPGKNDDHRPSFAE
jgi:hypothetical protein